VKFGTVRCRVISVDVRDDHDDETVSPDRQDTPPPVGDAEPARPVSTPEPPVGLGRDLVLYSLARFGIVAAVAVVLALVGVPALIGVVVGLIVGLPLAMLLFRGWHNRVSAGLAARAAIRREQRSRLRAELRGESAGQPDADTGADSAVTPDHPSDVPPDPRREHVGGPTENRR
jgi:hypothetical protein